MSLLSCPGPCLGLLLSVAPIDPAILAPGHSEFLRELDALRAEVLATQALEVAVARLQNRWAARRWADPRMKPCEDPEARSILAREPVFLAAMRDGAQSARVLGERADLWGRAETVAPILPRKQAEELTGLLTLVGDLSRSYLERDAWHAAHLLDPLRRCTPELEPVDGIGSDLIRAADDPTLPTAFIALGPRAPSATGLTFEGGVTISPATAPGGLFCVGVSCTSPRVLPGAVLAPGALAMETPSTPP